MKQILVIEAQKGNEFQQKPKRDLNRVPETWNACKPIYQNGGVRSWEEMAVMLTDQQQ